jgi:DNA polymerase delta subunit 3
MVDAPTNTATEEASEDAENESDSKAEAQTKPEPEETITVSDGRRRGRRRVMKKKTVQDEEGYLGVFEYPKPKLDQKLTEFTVTREEAAWESFSEEEPAPKKAKVSAAPTTAKTKKAAPKGQGNIMSFFSKK